MQEDANFTQAIKNVILWESELIEVGFKIQSLVNDLRDSQRLILQMLLSRNQEIAWWLQLIEPAAILDILERAEKKLESNLQFPRGRNNEVLPEILTFAKMSVVPLNNKILLLKLDVPLMETDRFRASKGKFIPEINGTLLYNVQIEKNVIIQNENKEWGWIISEMEFSQCNTFGIYKLCKFTTPQINLTSTKECLMDLQKGNNTENCKVRLFKLAQ